MFSLKYVRLTALVIFYINVNKTPIIVEKPANSIVDSDILLDI